MEKAERLATLNKEKYKDTFTKEIREELAKDKPDDFSIIKGAIELGNLVGSVFGLALFAPEVSHLIVHPVMKTLGMEKHH